LGINFLEKKSEAGLRYPHAWISALFGIDQSAQLEQLPDIGFGVRRALRHPIDTTVHNVMKNSFPL
jgi:hypothetical protein